MNRYELARADAERSATIAARRRNARNRRNRATITRIRNNNRQDTPT